MILNWIRKRMGQHICEEFAQWKTYTAEFSRIASILENEITGEAIVRGTKRWQERTCTLCGKVEQRKLEAAL